MNRSERIMKLEVNIADAKRRLDSLERELAGEREVTGFHCEGVKRNRVWLVDNHDGSVSMKIGDDISEWYICTITPAGEFERRRFVGHPDIQTISENKIKLQGED